MIGIPPRQNFHLYQSLAHAEGELLKHRLEKALGAPRTSFMGRIFGQIFGFSDFSGFRPDFGLVRSGIVLYIRVVFPNVGLIVQDLYYKPILFFCRISGPEFWCVFLGFR